MAGFEAMKSQKGIFVLSPDVTLVFLHARSRLMARLAHGGTGVLNAINVLFDIPSSLCRKGVCHV